MSPSYCSSSTASGKHCRNYCGSKTVCHIHAKKMKSKLNPEAPVFVLPHADTTDRFVKNAKRLLEFCEEHRGALRTLFAIYLMKYLYNNIEYVKSSKNFTNVVIMKCVEFIDQVPDDVELCSICDKVSKALA